MPQTNSTKFIHFYFEEHVKADLQHYKSNAGFKKLKDMFIFNSILFQGMGKQEQNTFIMSFIELQVWVKATHYSLLPEEVRWDLEASPYFQLPVFNNLVLKSPKGAVLLCWKKGRIGQTMVHSFGLHKCPQGLTLAQVIPSQGSGGGQIPKGQISFGKIRLQAPGRGLSGMCGAQTVWVTTVQHAVKLSRISTYSKCSISHIKKSKRHRWTPI